MSRRRWAWLSALALLVLAAMLAVHFGVLGAGSQGQGAAPAVATGPLLCFRCGTRFADDEPASWDAQCPSCKLSSVVCPGCGVFSEDYDGSWTFNCKKCGYNPMSGISNQSEKK